MYRLLIVDDEDIEREGMAKFMPWEKYEVRLAGTARNGLEGLEKIESLKPDIVITDIKMPVMDGLDLIREAKKRFEDPEFIVLSGYGEYEFTSRAMEMGICYYLLKPCDEEQIESVLRKVKKGIEEKREKEKHLRRVRRMLPRAKDQVFREMLLEKEPTENALQSLWDETEGKVLLLAFHLDGGFDGLERFSIGNIVTELLGERQVRASTLIDGNVLFLLNSSAADALRETVERVRKEFAVFNTSALYAAASKTGGIRELPELYRQIWHLLQVGRLEKRRRLVSYEDAGKGQKNTVGLVEYERIRKASDFEELIFEIRLLFMKMELEKYTFGQKREMAEWVLEVFCQERLLQTEMAEDEENSRQLARTLLETMAQHRWPAAAGSESAWEKHSGKILLSVFENIGNPELSVRFLAKKVLFMNEDYISRIFSVSMGEKFSAYLLRQRIRLAQRIMQYRPELRISILAEMVGYAPDGQYFSKAFRRISHMSPKEYKEKLLTVQAEGGGSDEKQGNHKGDS